MKPETFYTWEQVQSWDLAPFLAKSRDLSWKIHGKGLQCFIPGQMVCMGARGKYPAISLTGSRCALKCDHCSGRILEGMIPVREPHDLQQICKGFDEKGNIGILLSGGSDRGGHLPWTRFLESIRWVKQQTNLKISIHTGIIDKETALSLKDAGIDEVLIDVVGSEETMQQVYHLPNGYQAIESSLAALGSTGLPLIPHIVVGLHYGRIKGEMHALEMMAQYPITTLVVVVLHPLKHTPMEGLQPPDPETVGRFIAAARFRIPKASIALSCERPLGPHRVETDMMALDAGINRIAMPTEEALTKAKDMGLDVTFYQTCCSKSY
ncbi:MAG: radical SAM protein [Deltaproteobacteria bacterium]|nr:radical SAM protein [Deltaproteobacteria bacterium]